MLGRRGTRRRNIPPTSTTKLASQTPKNKIVHPLRERERERERERARARENNTEREREREREGILKVGTFLLVTGNIRLMNDRT